MKAPILAPGSRAGAQVMEKAVKGRSLWDDARRRLFRNWAAVTGMVVLVVLVVVALIGPHLVPFSYDQINKNDVWAPPLTGGHLLGADSLGRDLLARLLMGLRVSLAIGLVATVVSLVIGVLWGAIAGYVGGALDELMMRVVDVLYSLPFIFFVILMMVTFGSNIILIFVAIGAVEWLTMSRIVRGQTLGLKHKEFVEAARAAGLNQGSIITKHIIPNLLGPVVVYVTLTIPAVILAESFLSFLGLGVQPPTPDWSVMVSDAVLYYRSSPHLILIPGACIFFLIYAINNLGEFMRDKLDVRFNEVRKW